MVFLDDLLGGAIGAVLVEHQHALLGDEIREVLVVGGVVVGARDASGFLDGDADALEVVIGIAVGIEILADRDARFLEEAGIVHGHVGIGADGKGVELAVDGAGIDGRLVDLGDVEAVADIVVERHDGAVGDIFKQHAIALLDHVGHVAAGNLGGELGEIVGKAKGFTGDDHAGIFLVIEVDDGEGALVALGIAPPEVADLLVLAESLGPEGRKHGHGAGGGAGPGDESPAVQSAHGVLPVEHLMVARWRSLLRRPLLRAGPWPDLRTSCFPESCVEWPRRTREALHNCPARQPAERQAKGWPPWEAGAA